MMQNRKGFLTGLLVFVVALVADVNANPCAHVYGSRFVKDPMSCITYFSCVDSIPHRKACPEPFLFNEAKQLCDFAKFVNCDVMFNVPPTVSHVFPTVSAVEIPTVRTVAPRAFNAEVPVPTVSNVFPTVSAVEIPTVRTVAPRAFNAEVVPTVSNVIPTVSPATIPTVPTAGGGPTIPTIPTVPTLPTVPTTPTIPTENPQDPTASVPTTENEATVNPTVTPNPTVTQTPTPPNNPGQIVCNNQFVPRGSCPSLGFHQYGVQGDCTIFQTCIQGRAMFTNCPNGLLWNAATCQCDWPGRSNCPY